jgi:acyl-CoA thioester hydrolase
MAQSGDMRVVIDPEKAKSRIEVRVRFGETDLMGIVHHASYLSYFEAARVAWLRRRGVIYSAWAERGWHLPVVEATVRYRAPARFEDLLAVDVTLTEVRSCSLRFGYRVMREALELAEGETRLACVDARHELFRMPDAMVDILMRAETLGAADAVC